MGLKIRMKRVETEKEKVSTNQKEKKCAKVVRTPHKN